MAEDPRIAAARYRMDQLAQDAADPADVARAAGRRSRAIARRAGGPPGAAARQHGRGARRIRGGRDPAGDPPRRVRQSAGRRQTTRPDSAEHHDPDWWIKRKIETEKLTGLGPPALTLRVESAELADRLDEITHEDDVRAAIEDFNRRVIEARRQLLGGPPVVTPTREVDDEVRGWRERRARRFAAAARDSEPDPPRRVRWRLRRTSR